MPDRPEEDLSFLPNPPKAVGVSGQEDELSFLPNRPSRPVLETTPSGPPEKNSILKVAAETRRDTNKKIFELRDKFASKISFPRERIFREAQSTGKVPADMVISRGAAETLSEFVIPTVDEAGLILLTGGVAKAAGPVGRRVLKALPKKNVKRIIKFRDEVFRRASGPISKIFKKREKKLAKSPVVQERVINSEPSSEELLIAPQESPQPTKLLAEREGARIQRADPVFDSADARRNAIDQELFRREQVKFKQKQARKQSKVNRIKDIEDGRAGPLPEDPRLAAQEMSLIEKDAIGQIEAEAKGAYKFAREIRGGPVSLEEFVRERGGVRHFRPDATGRIPELEEWKALPKRLRANMSKTGGLPADEMADEAFRAGLLNEASDKALAKELQALGDIPDAKPWRAFVDEAERMLQDPQRQNHLVDRYVKLRDVVEANNVLKGQKAVRIGSGRVGKQDIERQIFENAKRWEKHRAEVEARIGTPVHRRPDARTGVPQDIVETVPPGVGAAAGDVPQEILEETPSLLSSGEPTFAGNIRISKFPRRDVRDKIREAANDLGLLEGQPHGGRVSLGEQYSRAEALIRKGVTADDFLRLPRETALNASEMQAAQLLLDDSWRKAINAQNAARSVFGTPRFSDLDRTASQLKSKARAMSDRFSEFKTTSGRAVTQQKVVNPEVLDLPVEYAKRLSKSDELSGLLSADKDRVIAQRIDDFLRMPKEKQIGLLAREDYVGGYEQFRKDWLKPTLSLWRASLVSQLGSAMRDFSSQGLRGVVKLIDDAVSIPVETGIKTIRGQGFGRSLKNASSELVEDFASIKRLFSRQDRADLDVILSKFSDIREGLFKTPVRDIKTEISDGLTSFQRFTRKYAEYLTWLRRHGELMQRRYFFDASFRAKLRRHFPDVAESGDFKNLDFEKFKDVHQLAADSMNEALHLTFAKNYTDGFAGGILKAMNTPLGDFLSLDVPFPRFMANAFEFLESHTPVGLVELGLSKVRREAFFRGESEAVKKFSSSIATGGMMIFGGAYLRGQDKYSKGTKWYELRLPESWPAAFPGEAGEVVDTRFYAPLISPFLFIGELVNRGTEKMQPRDIVEGLTMTRIAGVAKLTTEFMAGELGPESLGKSVSRAAGQFVGGFATPLTNFRDLLAGFSDQNQALESERIRRSTRENPLTGPFLARIPFANNLLPPAVSVTRSTTPRNESPWQRQLLGLPTQRRNALEEKLIDLNYPIGRLYSRTGDARADWIVNKNVGEIAEMNYPALITRLNKEEAFMKNQGLKQTDINETLREMVTKVYSGWKKKARGEARRENPGLFRKISFEKSRGRRRIGLIRTGRLSEGEAVEAR